jgi:hypothetical protein
VARYNNVDVGALSVTNDDTCTLQRSNRSLQLQTKSYCMHIHMRSILREQAGATLFCSSYHDQPVEKLSDKMYCCYYSNSVAFQAQATQCLSGLRARRKDA